MKVTNIKFHPLNKGSGKAFADVELEGEIWIKGFKVIEGRNGMFVSVPSEKGSDDKYWDRISFSDSKYYEKGHPPHPLLAKILEEWNKSGKTSKPSRADRESTDAPW